MRKLFSTVTLTAILTLLSVGMTFAQQNSDTATANVTADVVAAISITKTTDMNFGKVVAGATGGTVVLSTASARSATGGVTLGNAGATAAASFDVTGESGATYAITLPASATIVSGTDEMVVDAFEGDPDGTGTLTGGSETLNVGATLNVDASQPTGTYAGTFDVTVAYN